MATSEKAIPSREVLELNIPDGLSRVWAAYPEGLRLEHNSLQALPSQPRSETPPVTSPTRRLEFHSELEAEGASPGHSLVQASFFVCSVKGIGELDGLGNVYVETVVDPTYHLAFAKVCGSPSPAIAVELLQTRVLPFYQKLGVRIDRVFTYKSREYRGSAVSHPYEWFLASANIKHDFIGAGTNSPVALSLDIYHVLCREFFAPEFRRGFRRSFSSLQQELDLFLAGYNRDRVVIDNAQPEQMPLRRLLEKGSTAGGRKPGSDPLLHPTNL